MQTPELFLLFTRKLNELDVKYMITGSVASIFYGEPRMTNDIDLILSLKSGDAKRLARVFPESEFYLPPSDIIEEERGRPERGHFNIIHHESGFKADVYLAGNDALHAWGMVRTQKISLGDDMVVLAPPEYVMVRKLQFFREGSSEKHLRDINRMMIALGEDWKDRELVALVSEYGLTKEFNLAKNYDG